MLKASNVFVVPGPDYNLVGVVNLSVRLLSVDMLQDIHTGHPFPLRQMEPSARVKLMFVEDVVLDEEGPGL